MTATPAPVFVNLSQRVDATIDTHRCADCGLVTIVTTSPEARLAVNASVVRNHAEDCTGRPG